MKLGFQREGDLMEELKKQFTEDMRRLCIEIKMPAIIHRGSYKC